MKKLIIAPLNWGLGHATRCVPIINALIKNDFTPIIASDGSALQFLQKEFPDVKSLEVPSYNILYAKNVKWSLLLQLPTILKAVKKEQKIIDDFIAKNNDVVGIISDNRFGVWSDKVPSVYITHQLKVLSGWSTFFTSKIHQHIIKKFDECWIPDDKKSTFSGGLSSVENPKINKKYIGVLSRFKYKNLPVKNNILIILSGIEPQRTLLENTLLYEFKQYKGNIILIRGVVENQQKIIQKNHIKIYNFMLSNELERVINESKIIVCRSGYSSIMDLAVLHKKVFFIPTKYQNEQEYLATYLSKKRVTPFCREEDFTLERLEKLANYSGLQSKKTVINSNLFCLFKRK